MIEKKYFVGLLIILICIGISDITLGWTMKTLFTEGKYITLVIWLLVLSGIYALTVRLMDSSDDSSN